MMIDLLVSLWEGSLAGKVILGSVAIIVLGLGIESFVDWYNRWAKRNEEEL